MTTINWPTSITLDPQTVSLIVSTITGLVAAVTGSVALYIARQQWLTNRNQLRLHLFDKRFAVYEVVRDFAESVAHKKNVTPEELRKIKNSARTVFFLFNNKKLQDYCDELLREAYDLRISEWQMDKQVPGDEHVKNVESFERRHQWLIDQIDEIPRRFANSLRIRS
jgi:hypothetical protein